MTDLEVDRRAALKKRLLEYPGTTEEQSERQIENLLDRANLKAALLGQGYSNALAEVVLDRKGYLRPPGWHSVFFYPDSYRPRGGYLLLCAIVAAGAILLLR
jgi:hypothetical protein